MKTKILPPKSDEQTLRKFNKLCREEMKKKLLADILVDLTICELEGWDKLEYLDDIKDLINGFYERNKK